MARVLVLAEGQLGDLLILTPALRALKESFPEGSLTVLVAQRRRYAGEGPASTVLQAASSGTAEVLLRSPSVDTVMEVDRALLRSLPPAARIRAESRILSWLSSGGFTHVICTFPQERFVFWAAATRARVRVGQRSQRRSFLLTHRPDVDRKSGGVLRYYCALAEAAGARVHSLETEYRVGQEGRNWAGTVLPQLGIGADVRPVVVHPGASGPYRVWPPERYAELIVRLQRSGQTVLLCGSPYDRPVVQEVLRHVPGELPRLDPGPSVDRLAAVLERAALVISNDSGPRHLAVALHTPSLAFMPRFQDREWKIYHDPRRSVVLQGDRDCPLCAGGVCQDRMPEGESFGSACLRMVDVERAWAAVQAALRRPRN